ncbi:MAG: hypothetical protein QOH65_1557 [Methylobacteriaceae bacterium]|nr:hypothetical protein [Methylobacteriaceae bacterium]
MLDHINTPEEILHTYKVPGRHLYIVGTFASGVTVLSQQVRALNLVYALIEGGCVSCREPSESAALERPADETAADVPETLKKVAIIGAGFSGLTLAAGLIKKGAKVDLTLFEQRDTLLPLQQGSDSRWLHPHIYDWPAEGSEANAAMLPVLNWTAARASDVVVQLLAGWKHEIVPAQRQKKLRLYCNTRHLQVHEAREGLQVEWVGEARNEVDGTAAHNGGATGESDRFDIVVLTVGFGIEHGETTSYWRNEIFGQPHLDEPRRTYLVVGQGDGAMIDLLRLRISQYRQDRILGELFQKKPALKDAIKELYKDYAEDPHKIGLFDRFEKLSGSAVSAELDTLKKELKSRLRRDTDVILRTRVRNFAELFEPANTRISFQNKVLVYLLYKCGGFYPTHQDEDKLIKDYTIPPGQVVRRYGTKREEHLESILSEKLYAAVKTRRGCAIPDPLSQSEKLRWQGGYFGFFGPARNAEKTQSNEVRKTWRREYLPGPTALVAGGFCAGLAGSLRAKHGQDAQFRVTFHRAILIGTDELLQQCCDYFPAIEESTAARTFPARNATIGLAYRCRTIVRSLRGVPEDLLSTAMTSQHVGEASRAETWTFVLAIPILEPENCFTKPSPVAGVLYVDSNAEGFFIDDEELGRIRTMTQEFLDGLENAQKLGLDRIRNIALTGLSRDAPARDELPEKVTGALELVADPPAPTTQHAFQFNFDYSDFVF